VSVALSTAISVAIWWVVSAELGEAVPMGLLFGIVFGSLRYSEELREETAPHLYLWRLVLGALVVIAAGFLAERLELEPHSIERWGVLGCAVLGFYGLGDLRGRIWKRAPEAPDPSR
jgi:hypothetical protein